LEFVPPDAFSGLLCPVVEREGDCICECFGALLLPLCSFEAGDWEVDWASAKALAPARSAAAMTTVPADFVDILIS
jgi:hypothetical protein